MWRHNSKINGQSFGEVVEEDGIDGSALILQKIEEIAEEITKKGSL